MSMKWSTCIFINAPNLRVQKQQHDHWVKHYLEDGHEEGNQPPVIIFFFITQRDTTIQFNNQINKYIETKTQK